MKFCPDCGSPVVRLQAEFFRTKCPACGVIHYRNPKVSVAVVIVIDNHVLLVRRTEEPLSGWWTLPAGFVEYEETCEQAARREAQEEIGVGVELIGLQGVYSYSDDPRANMILVVYHARPENLQFQAGDDSDSFGFFAEESLPEKIAFSGMRQAIRDVFDRS
jgi:ADP-ribose pyrophosphatase YjhB (NUDIX family)